MARLIILGDSFAIPAGNDDPAQTWTRLAGQHLEQLIGEPVEVKNGSIMGSAQDWAWTQLRNYMPTALPTDHIVICLTHPSRFWFLEDIPQMTNVNIIDIERWITKDQERAIESFIRHIQRPSLDTQMMVHRMGWLAYEIKSRGLRRPLMIKCFRQEAEEAEQYPELNWSNGNLFDDIQFWEFEDPEIDINGQYWYGLDCRYNHMILSNHAILGPRVATALANDSQLDLKEGYIRGWLKKDTLNDQEFVDRELCSTIVATMQKIRQKEKNRPILPWRSRKNLDDIVSEARR